MTLIPAPVFKQPEATVTAELAYPIQGTHGTLKEVTLHRPTLNTLMALEKEKASGIGYDMEMLVKLTRLPHDTLLELDAGDFGHLVSVASDFLEQPLSKGPLTS